MAPLPRSHEPTKNLPYDFCRNVTLLVDCHRCGCRMLGWDLVEWWCVYRRSCIDSRRNFCEVMRGSRLPQCQSTRCVTRSDACGSRNDPRECAGCALQWDSRRSGRSRQFRLVPKTKQSFVRRAHADDRFVDRRAGPLRLPMDFRAPGWCWRQWERRKWFGRQWCRWRNGLRNVRRVDMCQFANRPTALWHVWQCMWRKYGMQHGHMYGKLRNAHAMRRRVRRHPNRLQPLRNLQQCM